MDLNELQQKLSAVASQLVDELLITRVGLLGVAIIRHRTEGGEFLPGSSSGAEQYSTTPMPLPYGKLRNKFSGKKAKDAGFRVFTSKAGMVWIVLPGGYKQYRQIYGKATDHVSLSWTGNMLRNLKVLPPEPSAAVIGFDNPDEALIASYHNTLGAGKSHKKHVFMGFTDAEVGQLTAETVKQIQGKIKILFA